MTSNVLLSISGLKKYYDVGWGIFKRGYIVHAVDGVSFDIEEKEIFGLAGESGCGKTTIGLCVLRLIEATSGEVSFRGENILKLPRGELRKVRRRMQIVFQDPFSSLNPRMTVHDVLSEPIDVHSLAKGSEKERMILEMVRRVGLDEDHLNRFPHAFSGGQRQRVVIARALMTEPEFIVADEPVSSIDLSVRAQILNMLQDLRDEMGLAILFISHDLSTIKHVCDRIGVMYLGKLMESAPAKELCDRPRHPYTRALLSAVPIPNPRVKRKRIILQGDVPTPIRPPSGCRFHTRCPIAKPVCSESEPSLVAGDSRHFVACYFPE